MPKIEIEISEVKRLSSTLGPDISKMSSVADSINSVRANIDTRIAARRNIGSRLNSAYNEAKLLKNKLRALQKFIDEAMDRYEKADKKVQEQSDELIILINLTTRTCIELDSITDTLGTSSPYMSENAKMFYAGKKVGDDDEDDDEKTKHTINAGNYSRGGDTPYDVAVGSKLISALTAGIDKHIGLDIEAVVSTGKKVSPIEVSTNLKNLGYNHAYRRGFLRDIPKGVRDVEVNIPKVLKVGKGVGILTV